jgi:predicted SAM-dependent methyltransferase
LRNWQDAYVNLAESGVRRLNWGCGEHVLPGWINADRFEAPGIDLVGDIRAGLPIESESIDYAVSIHSLPELPLPEIVPALGELRRVLKDGGTLRLAMPDVDRGIAAYLRGDRDYFLIPDEHAQSIGAKLIVQLLWYGHSRTLFTFDFAREMLVRAGFSSVARCEFGATQSGFPEIVSLDNRERETLFVEAVR